MTISIATDLRDRLGPVRDQCDRSDLSRPSQPAMRMPLFDRAGRRSRASTCSHAQRRGNRWPNKVSLDDMLAALRDEGQPAESGALRGGPAQRPSSVPPPSNGRHPLWAVNPRAVLIPFSSALDGGRPVVGLVVADAPSSARRMR